MQRNKNVVNRKHEQFSIFILLLAQSFRLPLW